MKTKKKILLSAVPIIAVTAVLLSLMLFRGGRLAVGSEEPAEVRFADSVYTLSSDDTEELRDIFAGKRLYRDNPSCGFDENASVKFGDSQTFCIAKDTCPIVYWKEKDEYIKQNPAYGRIICRCETVPEAEIVAAIQRRPGAVSVEGVKRRCRAGMGRCQSGFCQSRVVAILARELGCDPSKVLLEDAGSWLVEGPLKGVR